MTCNKCGASLPSEGIICLQCGAMFTKAQIDEQKRWQEINKEDEQDQEPKPVLLSEKYGVKKGPLHFNASRVDKNAILGISLIIVVLLIMIGIVVAKVLM